MSFPKWGLYSLRLVWPPERCGLGLCPIRLHKGFKTSPIRFGDDPFYSFVCSFTVCLLSLLYRLLVLDSLYPAGSLCAFRLSSKSVLTLPLDCTSSVVIIVYHTFSEIAISKIYELYKKILFKTPNFVRKRKLRLTSVGLCAIIDMLVCSTVEDCTLFLCVPYSERSNGRAYRAMSVNPPMKCRPKSRIFGTMCLDFLASSCYNACASGNTGSNRLCCPKTYFRP